MGEKYASTKRAPFPLNISSLGSQKLIDWTKNHQDTNGV